MLADSAPIFSTEIFLIQIIMVLVKKKITQCTVLCTYYSYYTNNHPTYNTHGYISSSGLILYLVQYDEENLSENEMFLKVSDFWYQNMKIENLAAAIFNEQ